MRLQTFLYFKTLASLPWRQVWILLKHSAHPAQHRLPCSSSVFLSIRSLSPSALAATGPQAGVLSSVCIPVHIPLAHEHKASGAPCCLHSTGLALVTGPCPPLYLPSSPLPSSAFSLASPINHFLWNSATITAGQNISLSTVSEASNITTVSLRNICQTRTIGQLLFQTLDMHTLLYALQHPGRQGSGIFPGELNN